MPEEQSHDNVTLADILEEIKDMGGDVEAQYRDSSYFAAYIFSGGVALVGTSFFVPLITPYWQMFNALGFILLGMGSATYIFWKRRKLRKEQARKRKALKAR